MSKNSNQICTRLRASGLNKTSTHQIVNLINKWTDNEGIESTVKRLKILKTGYIRKLAGLKPYLPQDVWIQKTPDGTPKGPLKAIYKMKKPQQAISALMVYSIFISPKVLPSQEKKFTEAVKSPRVILNENMTETIIKSSDKILLEIHKRILDDPYRKSKAYGIAQCIGQFDSVIKWAERDIRTPISVSSDPSAIYSLNELTNVNNSLEAVKNSFSHPLLYDFLNSREEDYLDQVPHIKDDVTLMMSSALMEPVDYTGTENIVGTIGFIQEPGYKLRTIANPCIGFQIVLSSMAKTIYNLLREIPEDGTHDQDRVVSDVQDYLKLGKPLMSIDLSSATDRFPLDVILKALKPLVDQDLINPGDLSLWEKLSQSEWKLPDGSTISWTNGQPLGVLPSFGAFAYAHHVLVRSLKPSFYRIIGDDIVIDDETGKKLMQNYTNLGLHISYDKSIESCILAEFGGRLITESKVYAQPKHREISDRSFLDLIKHLGPRGLGLLRPRQKKVVKLLAEIPADIHPWAMGWNPKGKPYQQRLDENSSTIALLKRDDLEVRSTKRLVEQTNAHKMSMFVRHHSDFRHLGLVPSEMVIPNWDLASEILDHQGISITDFSINDNTPGWVPSVSIGGDPRGTSTLEAAERKLQPPTSQNRMKR